MRQIHHRFLLVLVLGSAPARGATSDGDLVPGVKSLIRQVESRSRGLPEPPADRRSRRRLVLETLSRLGIPVDPGSPDLLHAPGHELASRIVGSIPDSRRDAVARELDRTLPAAGSPESGDRSVRGALAPERLAATLDRLGRRLDQAEAARSRADERLGDDEETGDPGNEPDGTPRSDAGAPPAAPGGPEASGPPRTRPRAPVGPTASIEGKVRRPGLYPVGFAGTELLDLVSRAGGFSETAAQRVLMVTRAGEDHRFTFQELGAGSPSAARIRPGDRVRVE